MIMEVWTGTIVWGKGPEASDFLKRVAAHYDKTLGLKPVVLRAATGPGGRYLVATSFESYAAREQLYKKRDADAVWKDLMTEYRKQAHFQHTETHFYEGV